MSNNSKFGICEKIQSAANQEEVSNLLAAAESYEFISAKTLRRARKLAANFKPQEKS